MSEEIPPVNIDPKKGMSTRTKVIAGVAVAVVVGAGVFGGIAASSGSTKKSPPQAAAGPNGNRGGGRGGFGGLWTLQSVNGSTLTLGSSNDGAPKTVNTSSSTSFMKSAPGAVSDIKQGDNVMVTGTSSGTDEVTAQSIRDTGTVAMGASGRGGPGGPGGPGGQRQGRGGANGGGAGRPGGGGANGNGGPPNGGGGFGGARGTVKSISGNTLVVSSSIGGNDVTVTTGPATKVSVLHASTLTAFTVGDQITFAGPTASDGSVTATGVQDNGVITRRAPNNGGGSVPPSTTAS